MHRKRRRTYCTSKKTYLGMMKNMFCQDINMQKMFGFLDEKYTPGNMKNMHAERTNILVKKLAKKLLCLQMMYSQQSRLGLIK
jgi:hypothetical protein